jgi:GT2 family glycosyltransferase
MTYVILVNWNSWEDTRACVLSLAKMVGVDFKIIVCDNNSSDDSIQQLEILRKLMPGGLLEVVSTGANLGFAGGNNVGLKIALDDPETSYVWLLNNDTTVESRALLLLLEKMRSDKCIGICGSTLLFAHEPKIIQAVGGKYNSWLGLSSHVLGGAPYSTELCEKVNPEIFDYVVGASMLVSRDFIEKVGLLDERYFLYCEELDWATRAKSAGFKLSYSHRSLVYHKEGASTGIASHVKRESRSVTGDQWALRSHLLYSMKFFPFRHAIVRAAYILRFMRRIFSKDMSGGLRALWAMLFVWR